jgi:ATP-dependent helicase/DNAse subunit B
LAAGILLGAASSGKTAHVLHLVRDAAQNLQATPRVLVSTHLQARSWRRRLAEAGGAIGVRVLTFDRLHAECLGAAGEVYTELTDPVQYRLIRAIVDGLSLTHYGPVADRPGFISVLKDLVAELKAARVHPDAFGQAVVALGGEPRLAELAMVYTTYQERLQAQGWADRAGLGWLAVEALEERATDVGRDWPLLVVDGFDSFTPVQTALLEVLAARVERLVVTLTGAPDGRARPLAHRRFERTRRQLEKMLGVTAVPVPQRPSGADPALAHLESHLFSGDAERVDAAGAVELIEAPDRAAEVRAGLRWLKKRLVEDGMRPGDVALLARDVAPYRPFIVQIAAEFGLPVRLIDGLPLRANPAVAALLDLLRLMLPGSEDEAEPALPRRPVIEAWRSPYFDWSALPADGMAEPIGIAAGDADLLDVVARWGRVIGGLAQWEEILADLAARGAESADDRATGSAQDEERGLPAGVPVGAAAQALWKEFRGFVRRLTPPEGKRSYREFVGWLETLLGPDPALGSPRFPPVEEPTALQVVARARDAVDPVAERDVAALQALKDVLRGLVWAEEALGTPAIDFRRFFDELAGAVDAASYRLPVRPDREEVLVADVVLARGVPFRAVAVLGLAEGQFPAVLGEDPFLRDVDRRQLREAYGLPLDPSTESSEAEFFYETVTRPRERLLLTRPRLADNGAPWQASPFWEEVRRLVAVEPQTLTSETVSEPGQAASWPELMESLAAHPGRRRVWDWVERTQPERYAALGAAVHVLTCREKGTAASPYEGDLGGLAGALSRSFGPAHTWSASRLEAYRSCPFLFFAASVLGLEPREEPVEGLDARQLGNIYHLILERLYLAVTDPADLDQLLAALPDVAEAVLDEAPRREGFRETAWWSQTRLEIVENVRRSVEALAAAQEDYDTCQCEAAFGLAGRPPLEVHEGDDVLCLRGLIDRLDQAPDGRVRVIDYKTAGPSTFTKRAVAEGKKLQLPLYALAARDALGAGEPVDGFYWHVRTAERSSFTLSGFEGGPQEAMDTALAHAWEVVRAARSGRFPPDPAEGKCPSYCAVASFCWHYRPGFGG